MHLPKYDDFFLPTLRALDALGDSGTIQEIDEAVVSLLELPEEALEAAYERSGALVIPDRLSWARSYLKMADLVGSAGRGVWTITEAGRDALKWEDAKVRRRVADAYNQRAKTYGMNRASKTDAFERLCQRLLREAGFVKVEVTGKSGDGGIDGIGVLRVRLVSFQVLFQCKRWKGSVGASTVRDFRGAMVGRADKGLIMTTGAFTADARREATRDGAPAIDLVDGDDLCGLLKELKIGVDVRLVEEITIDEAVFAAV